MFCPGLAGFDWPGIKGSTSADNGVALNEREKKSIQMKSTIGCSLPPTMQNVKLVPCPTQISRK